MVLFSVFYKTALLFIETLTLHFFFHWCKKPNLVMLLYWYARIFAVEQRFDVSLSLENPYLLKIIFPKC